MQRRIEMHAGAAGFAAPGPALAQAPQKPEVTIAVGGKQPLCYLPLAVAVAQRCFKDERLDVTSIDLAGGSRALQSVDEKLKDVKFDLHAVYTNEFVKKANLKYPKA